RQVLQRGHQDLLRASTLAPPARALHLALGAARAPDHLGARALRHLRRRAADGEGLCGPAHAGGPLGGKLTRGRRPCPTRSSTSKSPPTTSRGPRRSTRACSVGRSSKCPCRQAVWSTTE